MMNTPDELVTGHQTLYGDVPGSRNEGAVCTTDDQPSKLAEFGDHHVTDKSPYPVQETEGLSLKFSRISITSADCVPIIGVQKPQVNILRRMHAYAHAYILAFKILHPIYNGYI